MVCWILLLCLVPVKMHTKVAVIRGSLTPTYHDPLQHADFCVWSLVKFIVTV